MLQLNHQQRWLKFISNWNTNSFFNPYRFCKVTEIFQESSDFASHNNDDNCIAGNPSANHVSTSNPLIFFCRRVSSLKAAVLSPDAPMTPSPAPASLMEQPCCRAPAELRGSICQQRTPINRCFSQHDTRFSSTPDESVYIRLEPLHHLGALRSRRQPQSSVCGALMRGFHPINAAEIN